MTPLTYDFERAKRADSALELAGLTTETLGLLAELRALARLRFLEHLLALPGQHAERHGEVQAVPDERSRRRSTSVASRIRSPCSTRLFGRAVPEAQATPTPGTDQVRQRPTRRS